MFYVQSDGHRGTDFAQSCTSHSQDHNRRWETSIFFHIKIYPIHMHVLKIIEELPVELAMKDQIPNDR